ncbi:MAG TPA: hypothetical protein PLZ43_07015, partial [bacterium]|nr:hypothetical protein [bacterium]
NGKKIGDLTSEILAVTLGMKPAGFIRVDTELALNSEIELINEKDKSFKAFIRENPMVKGTSRKKMSSML